MHLGKTYYDFVYIVEYFELGHTRNHKLLYITKLSRKFYEYVI
jgi:hypothetical protein